MMFVRRRWHLHFAPKVQQHVSPGQSDAATKPRRAALGIVADQGPSPARAKQKAPAIGVVPFQGDQTTWGSCLPRAARRGLVAASLCPGLACCCTFGAKYNAK